MELRSGCGDQFPHPAHLSDSEVCEVCVFQFASIALCLHAFMACSYFHVIGQALSSLVPLNQAAAVARAFSPASVMSSPHEFFVLLNLSPEVLKSHRDSGTCKV